MSANSAHLAEAMRLVDFYISQHKYKEAIYLLNKALISHPNSENIYYSMGVVHHHDNNLLEAIRCYCEAIRIKPRLSEAYENLSQAQFELNLLDDALISIDFAINLNSKNARSLLKKANILNTKKQYLDAIEVATKAIKIDQKFADAYCARSNAYRNLNQTSKSISDLKKAIKLVPEDPIYKFNLAHELLISGQFSDGWKMYESRLDLENINRIVNPVSDRPLWTGKESIKDKRLLIISEQGLGDQIQFARYALLAKEQGANIVCISSPPLTKVLKTLLKNDIEVVSSEQALKSLPEHDFYCRLMSMPLAFKTNLSSIPKLERYIEPSAESKFFWVEKLKKKKRPMIGICWTGNPAHVNDRNRSMELRELAPILDLGFDWHIIQTDIRPKDAVFKQKFNNLYDWRNELIDFDRTAGLIKNLDLVISVDTSIVHLSASMGKDTWLMLPYAPDFRWLLNTNESPWYKNIKIFRQNEIQNWDFVIHNIKNEINRVWQGIDFK